MIALKPLILLGSLKNAVVPLAPVTRPKNRTLAASEGPVFFVYLDYGCNRAIAWSQASSFSPPCDQRDTTLQAGDGSNISINNLARINPAVLVQFHHPVLIQVPARVPVPVLVLVPVPALDSTVPFVRPGNPHNHGHLLPPAP